MRDRFENFSINIMPIPPNGYYLAGYMTIRDGFDELFWSGNFLIDKSLISAWNLKTSEYDDVIREIGVRCAKIYLQKDILPKDGSDLGITTYDVENISYTNYLELLKDEYDMLLSGRELTQEEIEKIHEWTKSDLVQLKSAFNKKGKYFASNGYSIFLFCLLDIWGSIIKKQFGKKGVHSENIGCVLTMLQSKYGSEQYVFKASEKTDLVSQLRDNLVHNYGLKVLHTNSAKDWPNIETGVDTDKNNSVIDKQANGRWHVNCIKLSENISELISEWTKENCS